MNKKKFLIDFVLMLILVYLLAKYGYMFLG